MIVARLFGVLEQQQTLLFPAFSKSVVWPCATYAQHQTFHHLAKLNPMKPKIITGTPAEIASKANKLLQDPATLGFEVSDFSAQGDQVALLLNGSNRPNHASGALLELAIIEDTASKAEKQLDELQEQHPGWKSLRVVIKPAAQAADAAAKTESPAEKEAGTAENPPADAGKKKKAKAPKSHVLLLVGLFQS
jgi:hypothetical protein